MKVIIAGSRSITDIRTVDDAIRTSELAITQIVSGGARGVDKLGEELGDLYDIPVRVFRAKWNDIEAENAIVKQGRYGPYNAIAGFQRNIEMGQYADALLAVWDGQSKGTEHMIEYMRALGKDVYIYLVGEETI